MHNSIIPLIADNMVHLEMSRITQ